MKNQLTILGVVLVLLMGTVYGASASKETTLGFIYMGDNGPFTEPAVEFAEQTFAITVLERNSLTSGDLAQFSVVWWHEGDTDPGALTDQEIQAFLDYAEAGGAILLTGWAIRYATPLGLEDVEARQFGPVEADGTNVGITLLDEMMNLPLWDGLTNIDGDPPQAGDRVQVNSTGYPKSGDYFANLWKNFITVANAWGPPANDWGDQIAAFGYWEAGDGKVFNMNWRLPNFHENNEDIEMLETLTENVIDWLASESAFAAVEPSGKLATTWGHVK